MRISTDRKREGIKNRLTCYHGAAHFEDGPDGHEELPLDPRGLVVDVELILPTQELDIAKNCEIRMH